MGLYVAVSSMLYGVAFVLPVVVSITQARLNNMPSEKVTRAVLAKTDMTPEQVSELEDGEAWGIVYSLNPKKPKDTREQIHFSGFGVSKKKELTERADAFGLRVVTRVTKGLVYLCVGANAGQVKMAQAEEQGVQCLSEEEFLNLISTGGLPDIRKAG